MRTLMSRAIAATAAGTIALSTMSVTPAAAASRNNGDAVAAAAAVAMIGTIAALIASSQHHRNVGYSYGPVNRGPAYRGPAYRGPVRAQHGTMWNRGFHRW
jgi:hypothetical protein